MYPRLHFTKFLGLSFALHALAIIAALFLLRPTITEAPLFTPVNIVNLPPETLKKLPPIAQKIPKWTFDKSDILRLPQTAPVARPSGGGGNTRAVPQKALPHSEKVSPLPFLSQRDIDEMARKGYDDTLKSNVLSEDTEAFKFLPYGRSLFARLNKNMRFPELASISGLQGDVYVIFEILKDGSLGSVTIDKPSGYKILDDEVIRTIRDSAPFQPLPPEWNKDRIIIPVVGIFRIYYKSIR